MGRNRIAAQCRAESGAGEVQLSPENHTVLWGGATLYTVAAAAVEPWVDFRAVGKTV
jgi:hypothetical protein